MKKLQMPIMKKVHTPSIGRSSKRLLTGSLLFAWACANRADAGQSLSKSDNNFLAFIAAENKR